MPRADSKLYKTLPYILAIPMVISGGMKLTGRMAAQFIAWGYPGWFSQFLRASGASSSAVSVGSITQSARSTCRPIWTNTADMV